LVKKSDHAIIHTSKVPPKPKLDEEPQRLSDGSLEYSMRPPIRVRPKKQGDRMNEMSRVNYAKVYTVEHYVKTLDFGNVHPKSLHVFISNFRDVWSPPDPSPIAVQGDSNSEEEDKDEEENNDDDNNDDNNNDDNNNDEDDDNGEGDNGGGDGTE
jgi:hypothetical protein